MNVWLKQLLQTAEQQIEDQNLIKQKIRKIYDLSQ